LLIHIKQLQATSQICNSEL